MNPIQILSIEDLLAVPEAPWLVTDHIHAGELGLLYGPPNSGKSFLALDWALHVATGRSWLGRYPVAQCPVLYLAGEGANSLQKRVEAWLTTHEIAAADIGVYFQCRAVSLREGETIQAIREALPQAVPDERGDTGIQPGMIIVDTLSQFFGGGDENTNDMTVFVNNLRELSQAVDTAILIVHHTNKQGLSERGHTSLRGNIDVAFSVKALEEDNRLTGLTLLNDKQRDDAKAAPVTMQLTPAGRSLVIRPLMPLTEKQRAILEIIRENPGKRQFELVKLCATFSSEKTVKSGIAQLVKTSKIIEENWCYRVARGNPSIDDYTP